MQYEENIKITETNEPQGVDQMSCKSQFVEMAFAKPSFIDLLSTKRNIFSPINCVKNDEEREGVVFFLDLLVQASRLFNIFGVRL